MRISDCSSDVCSSDLTTPPPIGVKPEHLAFIHDAMSQVVNGEGTARSARMNVPAVLLAGKTGTAKVRRITMAERAGGVRGDAALPFKLRDHRSEEHTSELKSLMRRSYAVFCLKKKQKYR